MGCRFDTLILNGNLPLLNLNAPFSHPFAKLCCILVGLAFLTLIPGRGAVAAVIPQADASEKPASQADQDLEDSLNEILAGHSYHGDAFNEGPRQKAYLMGGTGNVRFPVSTESSEAQAFINQGVGQLHGFWYLEAERSFRQAAAIDSNCAMAYWGAAMAAHAKRERSQGFIKKAVELKKELGDKLTEREGLYIDALEKYFSDKEKDKSKRARAFLKDLESIVIKYPDDIEAKAFVAHRIWHNAREGVPVSSYLATQSLINEIYEAEPLHPAHHYTIHLWDHRHPENAVRAAARCGVAAPSIAHMWHMPGHIYSRLKRYEDAVYQQEASARVDHAHMMRDRVLPDEINNFAHNNEWLIRNLIFIGRAHDAVDLARNMTDLPRHPKYNTLQKKSGSASYGRRRLLQALREFQLYDQAFALCQSSCLVETEDTTEHVKTLRLLGCASAMTQRPDDVATVNQQLNELLASRNAETQELNLRVLRLESQLDTSTDRPPIPRSKDGKKFDIKKGKVNLKKTKEKIAKLKQQTNQLEKAILAVEGYVAFAESEYEDAFKKLEKATGEDVSLLGELQFESGDFEGGLKKVQEQVKRRPQEVIPLARLAYLQYQNGDMDLSKSTFEKLRTTSTSMDLDIELFSRLTPIAEEFGFTSQWRKQYAPAVDLGFRPNLDSLGPFRWAPTAAPEWSLTDSENKTVHSDDFRGQPYIAIFYLGHGCLHCAEQLHAFAPQTDAFANSGIKMIAISTDDRDGLQKSIEDFDGDMPIRLASDEQLEIFKKFRAFDDFEDQPLHGTFLVDGNGMIRWQDISYEPFMKHEFLLREAERLLANAPDGSVAETPVQPKQVSQK